MRVTCPACHKSTTAPPELYGGRIACPHCDAPVNVPLSESGHGAPRRPRVLGQPGTGSNPLLWVVLSLGSVAVIVVVVVVLMNRGEELGGRIDQSRINVARSQMKVLEDACKTYRIKFGDWPESLEVLAQPQPDGQGPFMQADKLLDPWGLPYQYDPTGQNNNGLSPDIWCTDPAGNMVGNWMPFK